MSIILGTMEAMESGYTLLSCTTALEALVVEMSFAVVLEVVEDRPVEVCFTCNYANLPDDIV